MVSGSTQAWLSTALIGSLALTGCTTLTKIQYQQRYSCFQVVENVPGQPAQTKTSSLGYFSVFRIVNIDNTAKDAAAFSFDPRKLYVTGMRGGANQNGFADHQSGAGLLDTAKAVTVYQGTSSGPLGRVGIVVPSDVPKTAPVTEDVPLRYDGKNVMMLREGASPQFLPQCDVNAIE
ncbi:hypothetical protein [Sphingomonas endolithica]|uniref:hypothetical protein n=1 Tax=Sphingomonas endolithica TaxID=2972485 RepID=UPI0021AE5519|nr:hypothetical protein [Sphingomonas sp. ZFBP2030]